MDGIGGVAENSTGSLLTGKLGYLFLSADTVLKSGMNSVESVL